MALVLALVPQVLLALSCDGEGPVRFGVPLPAPALAKGLRASSPEVRLQWRRLQSRPDPETGRVWVELAMTGVRGEVRVLAGGVPASPLAGGPVYVREVTTSGPDRDGVVARHERWVWASGEVDERVRRTFTRRHAFGDSGSPDQEPPPVRSDASSRGDASEEGAAAAIVFEPGESLTTASPSLAERCLRVRVPPRWWSDAGVVPRASARGRPYREHLVRVAAALHELPGPRGRGDYGRSGGVVTNLEFDTALGFARLSLAESDPALLQRALDSARHLVDHDLDDDGLPFRHGKDHRVAANEPGHTWLAGLLLVGCLSADDELIAAAGTIARGLARRPAHGREAGASAAADERGSNSGVGEGGAAPERARDLGWPLLELETWLRFADVPACARMADALAAAIAARFDAGAGVVRFGEGERRNGVYEERAWLTGGILLPGLRAHAARSGNARIVAIVRALEQRLATVVLDGRDGVPVRYWLEGGAVVGQVRLQARHAAAEAFMVLEGLPSDLLHRALGRQGVQHALDGVPRVDDPDLATAFSIAARCTWILR